MNFHVIIPARYHSTRLPAKPLAMIGNKSMIEHVCNRAEESGALSVTVATDHPDIKDCVEEAGYNAVITGSQHLSGSDRINEAANRLGFDSNDIVVNVQGDEPLIPSSNIALVASLIEKYNAEMTTLCCPISDIKQVTDPNIVKLVFDNNNKALYFSRSPIPFVREISNTTVLDLSNYFRHIGIYAYRKAFLEKFTQWQESTLEKSERLEQLRALQNGVAIHLDILKESPPAGVDTAEDLLRINQLYES